MHPPLRILLACLLSTSVLEAATVFSTDFDDYTVGSLEGHEGWTISNGSGGTNQWFIAASGTVNPSAPASLGTHPVSSDGGNLFWIGSRSVYVSPSTTKTAYLAFTDETNRVGAGESFSVSFDLYSGPQSGGTGTSFNFGLAQGTSVASTAPLIRLHGSGSTTAGLRIQGGATSVASLDVNVWYRFELTVVPSSSTAGTWGVSVYALDSTGSIISTVFSESDYTYGGVNGGFDTFRFQTVSSRADYWIDNLTVSTIPEPGLTAALTGTIALLAAIRLRRR